MVLVQQFDEAILFALGTLAAKDVASLALKADGSREMGFRIVKSEFYLDMEGKTLFEGPVMIGVSIGLAAAGVEAAIEADPQSRLADIARGKGTFIKGLMMLASAQLAGPNNDTVVPIIVNYGKNGWSIPEGFVMNLWAYNIGVAALTTGTVVNGWAEHFGVWLND